MRIRSFVPRCTDVVHAMGLNSYQQLMRSIFAWHDCSLENGIELIYLTKYSIACKFEY